MDRGDGARSWQGGEGEPIRRPRLVVVTYVIAFLAPFLLDTSVVSAAIANSLLAWIGVAVGVVGLAIRIWAMRVLGPGYTGSLRTRDAQVVVEHDRTDSSAIPVTPARFSFGWAADLPSTGLWPTATALALLLVYTYRISAEERMLVDHFGDAYRAYKTRTWRLVPYVW